MEINKADEAELVDARDLKSPGNYSSFRSNAGQAIRTKRVETRLYCLTRRRLFSLRKHTFASLQLSRAV